MGQLFCGTSVPRARLMSQTGSVFVLGLGLGLASACGPQTPAFNASTTQSNGTPTSGSGAAGGANATAADGSAAGGASGAGAGGASTSAGDATGAGGATGASGVGANGSVTGGNTAANGGAAGAGANVAVGSGAAPASGKTGASGSTAGPTGVASSGVAGITSAGLHTYATTQKSGGKIDILWIIDDSASMSPEQDNLATNFNSFISQMGDAKLDFQTAVTTTDVCQDTMPDNLAQRVCPVDNYGGSPATHLRGAFIGSSGRTVLKSSDSDLVSLFNTYVRQGTDGSDFEHGLTAAQLALAGSIAGTNATLVRPDAFLSVIVLSDEEDDGIGLSKVDAFNGHNFFADGVTTYSYTAANMVSYLKGVKGAGNFSVSGIVGTRNSDGTLCSSSVASPREEGTQYEAAAQLTGGTIRSVCETDWGNSMTQIGLDVAAQSSQIALPDAPKPSTLSVYVNATLNMNWTYNTANNAIKFNAGEVPVEGADILVTYQPAD